MLQRVPAAQVAYEAAQTKLDRLNETVASKQSVLQAALELAQETDWELSARRPYDPDWRSWEAAWLQAHDLVRVAQTAYNVAVAAQAHQSLVAALARRVLAEAHRLDRREFVVPVWVN